jgi:MYXO-CTERM domain-containing protein
MKRWSWVGVALLLPAPALGYELTGSSWRMSAHPDGVPYCLVVNAIDANTATLRTQFANAVDAAVAAWTAAGYPSQSIPGIPCSAYQALKSSCIGTPSEGDDNPWIWWEDAWGSISGVGPSTIGVTPWWTSGSEITLAKIIFNDRDFTWSVDGSATDVGSIAVHEYGHWVGLDHYDEYSATKEQQCASATLPSVMCSYYSDGVSRIPTADDIMGVCYLYPTEGALGSACSSGGACDSGICHAAGYCTQACPPSCPLGYECVNDRCEREVAPPTCPVCATMPCGAGSVCIGASGGSICTGYCSQHGDCPLSFYCADLEGGGGVCWPAGNVCDDAGPAAGQACAGDGECAFGNICLQLSTGGDECFESCRASSDCSRSNDRCYLLEPGLGYCDTASTACSCDTSQVCQAGCSCDPDCDTCACDVTAGVCNFGCSCDPFCQGCGCDVTFGCDANCACDSECGCSCDATTACDADCDCDPECGGCNCALSPAAEGAPVLAVVLGLLGVYRRRRLKP